MSIKTNGFSKEEKICSDLQISSLFDKGTSFICYPVRVVWAEINDNGTSPAVKVLLSVSKKKLKHAVDRNRVKRLMRESYRLNKSVLYDNTALADRKLNICFLWLSSETVDFKRVSRKMREALSRISDQLVVHQNTNDNGTRN